MGIEEDIAASEQLIGGIVAEHDLDNKSYEELIQLLRGYSGMRPQDMSKRDQLTASILRVRLGNCETGRGYSGGNGEDNGDIEGD